jgi:hypothetical protein
MKLHTNVHWHCPHKVFEAEFLLFGPILAKKFVMFYVFTGFKTFANLSLSFHVRPMKLQRNIPWHLTHEVCEAEL